LLTIFEEYLKDHPKPNVQINFPKHLIENLKALLNVTKINGINLISIAPGSVWKTKQWKKEGFEFVTKELIRMGYDVVLLGSKDDFEICEEIATKTGAKNLAGMTHLGESLFIISISKLLITNDSSPTHLATLVNCPTITIYGPTIPEFGFYPRAPKSRTIQVDGLKCKPCSIHGYNQCPLIHHKCMNEIEIESVLSAAKEILET
jgi:heptosyltransferase-2